MSGGEVAVRANRWQNSLGPCSCSRKRSLPYLRSRRGGSLGGGGEGGEEEVAGYRIACGRAAAAASSTCIAKREEVWGRGGSCDYSWSVAEQPGTVLLLQKRSLLNLQHPKGGGLGKAEREEDVFCRKAWRRSGCADSFQEPQLAVPAACRWRERGCNHCKSKFVR